MLFNYSKLPLKHYAYGIKKIKFALSALHPESEDTICRISKTFLVALLLLKKQEIKTKKKFVMHEFLPKNKWMTLTDKKIFSDVTILITSWSQMLLRELTGNEKVFSPFWSPQCEEISQTLWLPIETDYQDSHSNCLSGSSEKMESNSWFSIETITNPKSKNCQMMSCPSYMCIHVGKMKNEDIRRTRKIRLYPTPCQKQKFREWLGTRRYVYNHVLDKIKTNKEKINFFDLRNKYVTTKNNPHITEWQKQTPKDIRAGAVRDLVKNYNTLFSKVEKGQLKNINVNFLNKKKESSIEIPVSSLKASKYEIKRTQNEIDNIKKKVTATKKVEEIKKGVKITKKDKGVYIYKNIMKTKIKISRRELKKEIIIKYDCRLQIKYNKWYLVVPYDAHKEKIEGRKDICALDPGVRSFQTIYSEEKIIQIKANREKLKILNDRLDKMKALKDTHIIRKRAYKKRERKIYMKKNSLIEDLHNKTIDYLTKNYQTIIIPPFESQDIVVKSKNRKMNRSLMDLQHYMFKMKLEAKCQVRNSDKIEITEEYTSKTCGRCGEINEIGGCEKYKCEKCHLELNRDINGARNIYIKTIAKLLL